MAAFAFAISDAFHAAFSFSFSFIIFWCRFQRQLLVFQPDIGFRRQRGFFLFFSVCHFRLSPLSPFRDLALLIAFSFRMRRHYFLRHYATPPLLRLITLRLHCLRHWLLFSPLFSDITFRFAIFDFHDASAAASAPCLLPAPPLLPIDVTPLPPTRRCRFTVISITLMMPFRREELPCRRRCHYFATLIYADTPPFRHWVFFRADACHYWLFRRFQADTIFAAFISISHFLRHYFRHWLADTAAFRQPPLLPYIAGAIIFHAFFSPLFQLFSDDFTPLMPPLIAITLSTAITTPWRHFRLPHWYFSFSL